VPTRATASACTPNVVWALDFQFDQTSEGRMLKFLNVVDEFTREALAPPRGS
jgi:putative transposase